LDFDDKHDKIAEIDPEMAKPGDALADVFSLKDLILEIENKSLTHRPDTFGIIGFAREVAGILGQKFDEPEFLTHEEVFPAGFLVEKGNGVESKDSNLKIEIADADLCPRYTAASLKVSDAEEQSKYLSEMQILLAKSGMMTVSRIVDVTNYLMLLTGQPLHAFDYDKLVAIAGGEPKIIVRGAKAGEKLELLDGKEIECIESDILITANNVPVALAGAMGGKSTEIDENTKSVLLESASFSLYNLRKTQMAHGIFSEAITRFTKGVPAGGTFNVLAEAVKEIGGKPLAVSDNFVGYHKPNVVNITAEEINDLLGTNYEQNSIVRTLESVSFAVERDGAELKIVAPFWRTDIHIKEDIIEEIGRLLGYDNIAPTLPLHATAEKNPMLELKRSIRDLMEKFGANELLTYSFVSEKLLNKVQQKASNSYKIVNSISPELQYVRQSIVPSLLEKAYLNEKLPVEKFAIYEMNKIYRKEWGLDTENVPVEKMSLGLVVAERKNNETAFYKAKLYVARLFEELNIRIEYVPLKEAVAEALPFEPKRMVGIYADNLYLGVVGEFRNSVRNEFKLAPYLAGFEVDLDKILEMASYKKEISFGEKKIEDLTITTDMNYGEALKEVQAKFPDAKVMPSVIYQAEGQKTKNITFHIESNQ
jgi:phenylalanyl-tRNA synthetase beta chain